MAISGVNTYNNAYENMYATKQKEETKETSAAQKKGDTENKGGLLNQLQDKYSNFDITAGTFSKGQVSSSSKGFQGVMISSAYLSKAENDEKTAQDLDEMLSGVESAYDWLKNAFARDGLAEQSEKSADRIKEKQEKAREQQVKSSKDKVVVVASSNEELLKKAKEAANGTNEKVLTKEEKALGNNFDLSI